MNNRLYDRPWLAGDDYSIADMICYPWTVYWEAHGQDIDDFRHVRRWHEALSARAAVQRGMAAGADLPEDPDALSDEEKERRKKLLYNQRARPAPG